MRGRVAEYQDANVGTALRAAIAEAARTGGSGYGPLLVNLGQGTTATHAAWAATAAMGVRSFHWGDNWEAGRHTADLNESARADHWNFGEAYCKLADCVNGKNRNG